MIFLIHGQDSTAPEFEQINSTDTPTEGEGLNIQKASDLLELYLDTEESSPLMPILKAIRGCYIDDLDQVSSIQEVYGLIYWLMADYGLDHRGESLEETADRLGDIDIENDSDKYTDLIFHLKDAVERIYDIELE